MKVRSNAPNERAAGEQPRRRNLPARKRAGSRAGQRRSQQWGSGLASAFLSTGNRLQLDDSTPAGGLARRSPAGGSAKKGAQLRVGFVRELLGRVVPARQHFATDVTRPFQPRLDRLEASVDMASLSPQYQRRHREFPVQIR